MLRVRTLVARTVNVTRLALLVVLLLVPNVARANETSPNAKTTGGVRYDFAFGKMEAELVTGAVVASTNFAFLVPQLQSSWGPAQVRGRHHHADDLSDFTGSFPGSFLQLGLGYVLEASYLELHGSKNPSVEALHAVAVETEALLLATGVTGLIKRLAGRCRPRASHLELNSCDEHDAFPSGHTSSVASIAGARLVRMAQTPTDIASSLPATSFALAEAATIATAYLRVDAGAHSWEDVFVGALVGHLAGITMALMHPMVPVNNPATTENVGLGNAAITPVFAFGGSF